MSQSEQNNSASHLKAPENNRTQVSSGSEDVYEKNTFLQVDPDISKAAYILRSFTSPLSMLAAAGDDNDDDDDDNATGSEMESTGEDEHTHVKGENRQRRRSVVVPFGPFETGEVVSVGMLDVQEKLKHLEVSNDGHLATPGQGQPRQRRGSVASVFFSPHSSQVGGDECMKQKLNEVNAEIETKDQEVEEEEEAEKKVAATEKPKKDNKKNRQKGGLRAGLDANDPAYVGQLIIDGLPESLCTTLMVRNIPNKYSQRLLVNLFKQYGFDRTFDFLYVPVDFNTRLNVGYCFINFTEPKYTQAFAKRFHGFHMPAFKSRKKIHISLANLQGLQPNIKKLVDSSLMMDTVAPEYQPLIFDCTTGIEKPFPSPANVAVKKVKSRVDDDSQWDAEDEQLPKAWSGTVFPRNPPSDDNKPRQSGPPRHHNNIGNAAKGVNDQLFFHGSVSHSMSPPPSPPSTRGPSFSHLRTDHQGANNYAASPHSANMSHRVAPLSHAMQHPAMTPPNGYGSHASPYHGSEQFGFTPPGLSRGGKSGGKGLYDHATAGGHEDWTGHSMQPPGHRSFRK